MFVELPDVCVVLDLLPVETVDVDEPLLTVDRWLVELFCPLVLVVVPVFLAGVVVVVRLEVALDREPLLALLLSVVNVLLPSLSIRSTRCVFPFVAPRVLFVFALRVLVAVERVGPFVLAPLVPVVAVLRVLDEVLVPFPLSGRYKLTVWLLMALLPGRLEYVMLLTVTLDPILRSTSRRDGPP